jgi:hypothetical protein
MKEDKRKIIVLCSKCNLYFHRACHNSKYPNHESNIKSWECKKGNNECLNIDPPIVNPNDMSPNNFSRGIRIGHLNVRDLMSKSKLNDI